MLNRPVKQLERLTRSRLHVSHRRDTPQHDKHCSPHLSQQLHRDIEKTSWCTEGYDAPACE
jgi:hypothetical protein